MRILQGTEPKRKSRGQEVSRGIIIAAIYTYLNRALFHLMAHTGTRNEATAVKFIALSLCCLCQNLGVPVQLMKSVVLFILFIIYKLDRGQKFLLKIILNQGDRRVSINGDF